MKKDKEWLKERILESSYKLTCLCTNNSIVSAKLVIHYIDQLDEPEIEENFYTFDNAKKCLHDNGFLVFEKDKLDEEIQRMVDETYEATNEKPVIPKFVADYIELNKGWSEDRQEYIEDDSSGLWFALDGSSYGMPNSVSDWLFNEEKVETFAKAWLDGYEVEKEPVWVVSFTHDVYGNRNYFCGFTTRWGLEKYDPFCPNGYKNKDARGIIKFTDKAKAEAVALLIDGEAEEVT